MGAKQYIALEAPLGEASAGDTVRIELWQGFGALTTTFGPGTYVIDAVEASYDNCGVCVNSWLACTDASRPTGPRLRGAPCARTLSAPRTRRPVNDNGGAHVHGAVKDRVDVDAVKTSAARH